MSSLFSNRKTAGGFTLIELMVTVGIFVVMTALMLARYDSFYNGTIFNNLAYDIALTIRQAQTYGISVKANTSSGTSFNYAYGVFFPGTAVRSFTLAAYGKSGAGYLPDSVPEKTYNIRPAYKVATMCVGADAATCVDGNVSKLHIIFKRPNPEAIICSDVSISCDGNKFAKITIKPVNSPIRHYIEINSVGQITVR